MGAVEATCAAGEINGCRARRKRRSILWANMCSSREVCKQARVWPRLVRRVEEVTWLKSRKRRDYLLYFRSAWTGRSKPFD